MEETGRKKKEVWPGTAVTRVILILVSLVHSEVRTQPLSFHALKPMDPAGSVKLEKKMMLPRFWELKSLPSHAFQLVSPHLNPRDLVE